jgi:hypothetical protein
MRTQAWALAFVTVILLPRPTVAAGALAVGVPPDVAKTGFTYGGMVNKPSEDEARTLALKGCRETRDAVKDPKLASLCVVIGTFHDQCFAIAWDPKAGTPGVGWSISPTRQEAESKALANCRATAGAGRRDYCVVDNQSQTANNDRCDGSAK